MLKGSAMLNKRIWSVVFLLILFCYNSSAFLFTLLDSTLYANGVNWGTNYYHPDERNGVQYDGLPLDGLQTSPVWTQFTTVGSSTIMVTNDYLSISTDSPADVVGFKQTRDHGFDLANDSTVEITFRVASQLNTYAAGNLHLAEEHGADTKRSVFYLYADKITGASSANKYEHDFTQWTTVRMTIEDFTNAANREINVYIDNDPFPVLTETNVYGTTANYEGLMFGDLSSVGGGTVEYRSIRWTSEGAFAPVVDSKVSSTIDFLDFAWFQTDPAVGYFTESQYEEVFKDLVRAGVSKVYLRVNVLGWTLYPTKVGSMYSGDGRGDGSTYLVNTLTHYDPLEKAVEFGHKYGLEVWAWENMFDDAGTILRYPPGHPDYDTYGEYPLMDPYLATNTDLLWALDPQVTHTNPPSPTAGPVTKIRITSTRNNGVPRMNMGLMELWVGTNEWNYSWHTGASFSSYTTNGFGVVLVDSIDIAAPTNYFKIYTRESFPASGYTMVGTGDSFVEVYFDGAWHSAPGGISMDSTAADGNIEFTETSFAWDYGNRTLGFSKFRQLRPWYGMVDYSSEELRQYKLAKFAEVAAYGFDGFSFSLRSHTLACRASLYGYNQSIRDLYLARYGVDIWTSPFDRDQWLSLRAEGVTRFLKDARALIGSRPLYMDVFPEGSFWEPKYGGLPFEVDSWIGDPDGWMVEGVDAVRLLAFTDHAYPEVDPRSFGDVGVTRFVDNTEIFDVSGAILPDGKETFQESLPLWLQDDRTIEVELYETLYYLEYPELFEFLHDTLHAESLVPPLTTNGVDWETCYYDPDVQTGARYDGLPTDGTNTYPVWRQFYETGVGGTAMVVGDYLRLSTATVADSIGFKQISGFDLNRDSTLELTFRVVSQADPGKAAGHLMTGQRHAIGAKRNFFRLYEDRIAGGSTLNYYNHDFTQWTTVRITFENYTNAASRLVNVYIDGNSAPVLSESNPAYFYDTDAGFEGLMIGDLSPNSAGGTVDYKSIRWTSNGAFAP